MNPSIFMIHSRVDFRSFEVLRCVNFFHLLYLFIFLILYDIEIRIEIKLINSIGVDRLNAETLN